MYEFDKMVNRVVYVSIALVALVSLLFTDTASALPPGDSAATEMTAAADSNSDRAFEALSVDEQVRLLAKQLNALTYQRREDYKMLEGSLKKYVRKNAAELTDGQIREELDQLRADVNGLREHGSASKERLTVQWLSQSMAELRSELAELQQTVGGGTGGPSKEAQFRNQLLEDLGALRSELGSARLELEALRSRQEKTEVLVRELQEEAVQSADDLRRSLNLQHHQHHSHHQHQQDDAENKHTETESAASTEDAITGPAQLPPTIDFVEPEADHRMRHQRFIRQQLHELEVKQSVLKRQVNELHGHRLADRLRSVEIEQRRLASAGFNVSRQVASLDKLHGSMLELLEDVEAMQTKFDKTVPDLRREIAKVEYSVAQVVSEQGLVREEVHNTARSVQAMAVSVSALQEERSTVRQLQTELRALKEDVARVRSATQLHREMAHNRIEKLEADSKPAEGNATGPHHHLTELERTTKLVQQLETVQAEYESIINKLPRDCSQIERLRGAGQSDQAGDGGLYLIAPAEQHHPLMTQCFGEWTTVQRRQDGSVDFNRSWEDYAQGFGTPAGEFWIGNEPLHHLTQDNCSRLRIIMQDIYDNTWHADYATFRIGSREAGFRLELGGYSGNASDAFEYQNRMQFSAIDVDRDISNTHCAGNYEGGWWFSHCQHANLNGRYNLGLTWFDASRNEWIAVKSSHMMIARRSDCGPVEGTTTTTTTTTTTARATTSGITTTAIPGTTVRSLVPGSVRRNQHHDDTTIRPLMMA
ncbi:protein scabrous [Anopheles aquasalis]|uniref:protein scabrous n=1 Tax=Anopheles aquasalis TaxID=42839 RepID=UPI00215AC6C7|nr:protein scabrous [Anopheles aquasalis]